MNTTKLDELRGLLLGPDYAKLGQIANRVEQREQRTNDVAEVLPASITESFHRDSALVGALRTPLKQCVSESVRENPEEYADALFPIMGPAIRRAVAEAFKGWIQQANQAIEHSLSPRGVRWRLEAWRAGIPFGQYVLQRTLVYRVEHIYLIQSSGGLLIAHVQQPDATAKDEDAVSAMFTAIQEFVKDSFTSDEAQRLRTAELGDFAIWAVHSPSCIVVAVIRGAPPTALRTQLETALEHIETQHSEALKHYLGNRDTMRFIEPVLQRCLLASPRETDAPSKPPRASPAIVGAVLAATALVGGIGYSLWMDARAGRVEQSLDASPGIVVTEFSRDGRTLRIRGLRDPLAGDVAAIAALTGWRGGVESDFRPFLSLEPDMLLQRAHAVLHPPAGVRLAVDGTRLTLAGTASQTWIDRLRSAPVPGIDDVDSTALVPDASESLARMRAMQGLAAEIAATVIEFAPGERTPDGAQYAKLDQLAAGLREYGRLAELLSLAPRLTVVGQTDDSGPREINLELERSRAEYVGAQLGMRGVPQQWLLLRSRLSDNIDLRAEGVRAAQVSFALQADKRGALE